MEPELEEGLRNLLFDEGHGERTLPNFTLISKEDMNVINKKRVALYAMLTNWDFNEARDDFVKAYKLVAPEDFNGIEDI